MLNQESLRELIHECHRRPLRVCIDDGRTYLVRHPDFALAGRDALMLASGPGNEFGAPFVICGFEHIARVEVLGPADAAAA